MCSMQTIGLQDTPTSTIMQSVQPKSNHAINHLNDQPHFIIIPQSLEDQSNTRDAVALQNNSTVYHYVESGPTSDHSIYSTSIQYQEYPVSQYNTPVSTEYYQQTTQESQQQLGGVTLVQSSSPCSDSAQINSSTGQLVAQYSPNASTVNTPTSQGNNNTYLVQTSNTSSDAENSMPHATRASPVTVQWLIDNYETAEGVSLPRNTLYTHYLRHCHENTVEPMNPASFGKLIRSVYLGLRTRRLGTRGNSKYHYYGIRIKASSPLNDFVDEDQSFAMKHYPDYHKQCMEADNRNNSRTKSSAVKCSPTSTTQCVAPSPDSALVTPLPDQSASTGQSAHKLPDFEDICRQVGLPWNMADDVDPCISVVCSVDHLVTFVRLYASHCSRVFDAVIGLNFASLEALWQSFWRSAPQPDADLEHCLPVSVLESVCCHSNTIRFIELADQALYQGLVEVIVPDVLRPIPSTLTQGIRNFAKSLQTWMRSATRLLAPDLARTKVAAVSAFAQTLRRYTSLNHMAQAARAVLHNTTQMNQMLDDLNRVDFVNVQEQASWVCTCDSATVSRLEADFKKILEQRSTLEDWAVWLDQIVTEMLDKVTHQRSQNKSMGFNNNNNNGAYASCRSEEVELYARAGRQLLLKWAFYSSLVIRDLTLRSAASFGSFHLIRLLYDEYIYYLVEHKVAAYCGMTPLAVISDAFKATGSGLEDHTLSFSPLGNSVAFMDTAGSNQANSGVLNPTSISTSIHGSHDLLISAADSGSHQSGTHCSGPGTVVASATSSSSSGSGVLSASYHLLMNATPDINSINHQHHQNQGSMPSQQLVISSRHRQNANDLTNGMCNDVGMENSYLGANNCSNSEILAINNQASYSMTNRKSVCITTGDTTLHALHYRSNHPNLGMTDNSAKRVKME